MQEPQITGQLAKLFKAYKALGAQALALNHYDLAKRTEFKDVAEWKAFLIHPEISDWIRQENELLRESEMNKLISDINQSNSVGKAQLISILQRLKENKNVKTGPTFVYCYIPLNKDQENAPNVTKLTEDPFLKEV